ncbi:3-dehydroquinate synthase [Marinivivus vitaminiproducens]|uniref:3-dehydroquinate synthase n=1 Tax=Marinivivus vitaminiproducens TaxID=3035935 RepID=UPI00279D0168|nr:3-dehydroquinate synthase [Geminicoccaceae bacterium SCSIO 64248]
MSVTHELTVALGARSYPIRIGDGLLGETARHLAEVGLTRPPVVVSDKSVAATAHFREMADSLEQAGLAPRVLVVPPGEASKSFGQLERLCEEAVAGGIDRKTPVIGFGGGVVGDLAGVAAAVLLRGLPFVQVPTTLLAQVDSAVGGKTGINLKGGKNLVGSFHQPRLVLADVGTLATLPPRELRAGYAEVVKYGLLGDADFFAWLEANGPGLLTGDPEARAEAVLRSCRHKAGIVAEDEHETTGLRALLNLGHTFGHALEALEGYSGRLLHGEAVACGMVLAFRLSVRLGLCPESDLERMRSHLDRAGLPVSMRRIRNEGYAPDTVLDAMMRDKKVEDGRLGLILVRGIGRAFVTKDVAPADVRAMLVEDEALTPAAG